MPIQPQINVGLGAPLGNASYESFEKTLNQTGNILNDAKDLSLMLVKAIYSGNNTFLNKVLKKYRLDCQFRKAIRDATTLTASMSALGYSFIRDRKCMNNIDRLTAIAGTVALLNNLRLVLIRYNKKSDTPMVGASYTLE